MAVKKHKGIRNYTGDEVGNLAIGQGGFDICGPSTTTTSASKGVEYWVALKVVGGDAALQADIHADFPGESYSQDGAAGGTAITTQDGDMIYGAFINVTLGSGDYVVAYRG